METLGQYLRREREFRRVSLEEISDATKVSIYFLNHLESDNLEVLPSGAFVRGYLKSYAKFVGLDVNEVLLRFDVMRQQEDPGVLKPKARRSGGADRKRKLLIFGVVLAAIVLLAFFLSSR